MDVISLNTAKAIAEKHVAAEHASWMKCETQEQRSYYSGRRMVAKAIAKEIAELASEVGSRAVPGPANPPRPEKRIEVG